MKVLICPLNWGLGHATRCVPIIRQLISEGHEPVIVSDGFPLNFLKLEFPSSRFIDYPSYQIEYSSGNSQLFAMIQAIPAILKGIYKEHRWLDQLLRNEHFDRVISDNRFGMWNNKIHTIFITHQIMIKMPRGLKALEPVFMLLNRIFIHKYSECWIPDNDKIKLTGDLSHKYKLPTNAKYIGILSRFNQLKPIIANKQYEIVALVSGIEPQRSLFESFIINKYSNKNKKILILTGKPQKYQEEKYYGNMKIVSHLPDQELAAVLVGAKKIISRSGYSTIMDLAALKCLEKANFYPTPGQTEQEYLASIHSSIL